MNAFHSILPYAITRFLTSYPSFSQIHVLINLLCMVHNVRVEFRLMLFQCSDSRRLFKLGKRNTWTQSKHHIGELVSMCIDVVSLLISSFRACAICYASSCSSLIWSSTCSYWRSAGLCWTALASVIWFNKSCLIRLHDTLPGISTQGSTHVPVE